MRSIGRAVGAIGLLNALADGVGAAAAIDLAVEARVDARSPGARERRLSIRDGSESPLARTALEESARTFDRAGAIDLELELTSEIPAGRGLKSSSAVAVAIARAVARAVGAEVGPADAARVAVRAGRLAGVSATGAFDDACACSLGGLVVTHNSEERLLRHDAPDPRWVALLWIPRAHHPSSPSLVASFASAAAEVRGASLAARSGRYLVAMERNGELVERRLGYDYRELRRRLRSGGALSAGVSGMGPAVAALGPREPLERLRDRLADADVELRVVDLVRPGATEDRGPVR